MPVYLLRPKHSGGVADLRLVRANSRSQAMRHVAETHFECDVAKSETVAELMVAGKKCEDARAPETAELPLSGQAPPPVESESTAAPLTAVQNLDALDKVLDQANSGGTDPYLNGITERRGISREAWPEGEPTHYPHSHDEPAIDTVSIEGIDHVS